MINIIKTAIITIIISFISGLLLDYYKNLAPGILCNIGNAIPLEMNGKKISAYIITVTNVSKKTIHQLTLNIQSSHSNLNITAAKITKGLKFDSSIKDNILDVYIPFLSKDDEFSVTVYVENEYAVHSKPVIVIRSPENFKRIDSTGQKGILALLFNIPQKINQAILKITKKPEETALNSKADFTTAINKPSGTDETINKGNREVPYENKKLSKNIKVMIITVSIILVIIAGAIEKSYLKGTTTDTPASTVNSVLTNQSTDVPESSGITNNSAAESAGYNGTNTTPVRSTGNTSANSTLRETTGNNDSDQSTRASSENNATNASTEASSENKGTNTSTETSTGNTDSNISTKSSTANTTANTVTGASSENTAAGNSATENTAN